MPSDSTQCHWGTAPTYSVAAQSATFALDASLAHVRSLFLFTTNVSAGAVGGAEDFVAGGQVPVVGGQVTLQLQPYMLYTLSTLNSSRGSHPTPPPPTRFPLPYSDTFDTHPLNSEAPYFFDQAGSWQVVEHPPNGTTPSGRVMRQAVLQPPVGWCGENPVPYAVLGDHAWMDLNVTVRVLIEAGGGEGWVATRVSDGGCVDVRGSSATAFGVSTEGWWAVCNSTAFALGCSGGVGGKVEVQVGRWYTLTLVVEGERVQGWIDGRSVVNTTSAKGQRSGWAGIGSSWSYVQFDDFSVSASSGMQRSIEGGEKPIRAAVE